MAELENLGVITKAHPSGMRETDKGFKVFDGNVGDTVMQEQGKKAYIVKADEAKKQTVVQKTELEVLREEAIALGIDGGDKMGNSNGCTTKRRVGTRAWRPSSGRYASWPREFD